MSPSMPPKRAQEIAVLLRADLEERRALFHLSKGPDNRFYTAAWEPGFADWCHGWWPIGNTLVPAGGPVHAVSRSADKLDIFATNVYGVIQTAAWEPGFTDGGHGGGHLRGNLGSRTAGPAPATCSGTWVHGRRARRWPLAWEPGFTGGGHGGGHLRRGA